MGETFFGSIFRKAIWRKPSTGDGITAVLGALSGAAVHFLPERKEMILGLEWQIAVFAIAAPLALRIAASPWLVWRDQKLRADNAEKLLRSPEHILSEKMAENRAQILSQLERKVSEVSAHYQFSPRIIDVPNAAEMAILESRVIFAPFIHRCVVSLHAIIGEKMWLIKPIGQ